MMCSVNMKTNAEEKRTVATPGGEKLQQNGDFALEHNLIKVLGCEVNNIRGSQRTRCGKGQEDNASEKLGIHVEQTH